MSPCPLQDYSFTQVALPPLAIHLTRGISTPLPIPILVTPFLFWSPGLSHLHVGQAVTDWVAEYVPMTPDWLKKKKTEQNILDEKKACVSLIACRKLDKRKFETATSYRTERLMTTGSLVTC